MLNIVLHIRKIEPIEYRTLSKLKINIVSNIIKLRHFRRNSSLFHKYSIMKDKRL